RHRPGHQPSAQHPVELDVAGGHRLGGVAERLGDRHGGGGAHQPDGRGVGRGHRLLDQGAAGVARVAPTGPLGGLRAAGGTSEDGLHPGHGAARYAGGVTTTGAGPSVAGTAERRDGRGHTDGQRRRAFAAAVVLALAWGCSSGGDDEGTGGAATDPGPPATTAPAEPGPAGAAATCWTAPEGGAPTGEGPLGFEDVTGDVGLVEPLLGMYGHAAATADVDGDGWTDLFVGGFADRDEADYRVRGAEGPSPDRLLLGGPDEFRLDDRFPGELARTSGATFADLDGDGDLDLVVARNPQPGDELTERPTTVYENRGDGWAAAAELAPTTAARSVAALDVDRDGLTDLLVLGDRFGDGPTLALRNAGGFDFEDATVDWGVPDDLRGLALATVDLDGDGRLDVVTSGDPRVLRGGPDGFTVEEVPELRWRTHGDED